MEKDAAKFEADSKLMNIKKQVEFYFSDSNFRKDTFLRAAAETDPEGFIPVAVLLTFNKLKAMTTDPADVIEALKTSESVVVNPETLKLRRSAPLPEEDTSKERTLYVKGYPIDDTSITIDSIREQFSVYGTINMVRLRKDTESKAFKGSCFVEYESSESVETAVKESYDEAVMKANYNGRPFECIMPLSAWLKRKQDKHQKHKTGKKKSEGGADNEDAGSSDDEGKALDGKRKREESTVSVEKKTRVEFEKGLIIKLTEVPKEADLFQIKDLFKTFGNVKFVEFTTGDSEAHIRAADVATAEAAMQAIEKGLKLTPDGPDLKGFLLADDDELAYWTKIANSDKKRSGGGGRGGRGGRGRGGRGGRGGRKRTRD